MSKEKKPYDQKQLMKIIKTYSKILKSYNRIYYSLNMLSDFYKDFVSINEHDHKKDLEEKLVITTDRAREHIKTFIDSHRERVEDINKMIAGNNQKHHMNKEDIDFIEKFLLELFERNLIKK